MMHTERDATRALQLAAIAWVGPPLLIALVYVFDIVVGAAFTMLVFGVGVGGNVGAWAFGQRARGAHNAAEAVRRRGRTAMLLAAGGIVLCMLFGVVAYVGSALAIR